MSMSMRVNRQIQRRALYKTMLVPDFVTFTCIDMETQDGLLDEVLGVFSGRSTPK